MGLTPVAPPASPEDVTLEGSGYTYQLTWESPTGVARKVIGSYMSCVVVHEALVCEDHVKNLQFDVSSFQILQFS